jgi:hypothetical protein
VAGNGELTIRSTGQYYNIVLMHQENRDSRSCSPQDTIKTLKTFRSSPEITRLEANVTASVYSIPERGCRHDKCGAYEGKLTEEPPRAI